MPRKKTTPTPPAKTKAAHPRRKRRSDAGVPRKKPDERKTANWQRSPHYDPPYTVAVPVDVSEAVTTILAEAVNRRAASAVIDAVRALNAALDAALADPNILMLLEIDAKDPGHPTCRVTVFEKAMKS